MSKSNENIEDFIALAIADAEDESLLVSRATLEEVCVELRRLRDENERLKTDAERWRCTRKYGAQEVGLVWHTEDGVPITMHDVRADFAVDAMIRMLNKQGTTTCRLTR